MSNIYKIKIMYHTTAITRYTLHPQIWAISTRFVTEKSIYISYPSYLRNSVLEWLSCRWDNQEQIIKHRHYKISTYTDWVEEGMARFVSLLRFVCLLDLIYMYVFAQIGKGVYYFFSHTQMLVDLRSPKYWILDEMLVTGAWCLYTMVMYGVVGKSDRKK